jgi:hypothetical protein
VNSEARPFPPAEQLVDELLPEDLEWKRLVRSYPRAALVASAAAGFLLGYRHGEAILESLGRFAAGQTTRAVDAYLGGRPLGP